MEDQVMNSEEIVEETAIENVDNESTDDYVVEDESSMLPAIALGVGIGAVAAYGIPKAVKGAKKLVVKGKDKVAGFIASHKKPKETESEEAIVTKAIVKTEED